MMAWNGRSSLIYIYIYIRINEFMISVVGDDDEGASSGAIDRPRRVHGRQHMLPSGAAISQPRRRPPAHRSARYAWPHPIHLLSLTLHQDPKLRPWPWPSMLRLRRRRCRRPHHLGGVRVTVHGGHISFSLLNAECRGGSGVCWWIGFIELWWGCAGVCIDAY